MARVSSNKSSKWLMCILGCVGIVVVICIFIIILYMKKHMSNTNESDVGEAPTIMMDGVAYVAPYMPVSRLPYGYALRGNLTSEQANNTGLTEMQYYTHTNNEDVYVYQECGTPVSVDEIDNNEQQWAYMRWVRADIVDINQRELTLDEVIMLADKKADLQWSDFDPYIYSETGSGLYIRIYKIDEMYELWIGGDFSIDKSDSSNVSGCNPQYFYLKVNDGSEDKIDIRTEDVEMFVKKHAGMS